MSIIRKKVFIKYFIISYLLSFLLMTLATKYGFSKSGLANPVNWNNLLYEIPIIAILSLIISILFSLYNSIIPETVMCNTCFKHKKYDKINICECGGKFIDFRFLKHIGNNKSK